MKKRLSHSRPLVRNPGHHNTASNWHNGPGADFYVFAGAFHTAAKTLVANLDLDRNARTVWDACPIIFLYRRAFELYLKAIVLGDETSVLKSKHDPVSIYRTHSLRRLAKTVCGIVKELGWEQGFTGDGVANLSDFIAIISEIDNVDLESYALRYPANLGKQGVVEHDNLNFSLRDFAKQMDAVLDLLDLTADAMAATRDRQNEVVNLDANRNDGDGFEPTIQ
jgi:hypothetical protein